MKLFIAYIIISVVTYFVSLLTLILVSNRLDQIISREDADKINSQREDRIVQVVRHLELIVACFIPVLHILLLLGYLLAGDEVIDETIDNVLKKYGIEKSKE